LTTHRGIFYLHVEQFLALYALIGFFGFVGATGMLSASVSDFAPFSGISWGWFHTRGGFFLFSFLVVWLHNIVFNKPFCNCKNSNDSPT
jgi:hypothetical protein